MNSEFNNWYFRAYAKNGRNILQVEPPCLAMQMEEIMNEWLNAVPTVGMSGWWNSTWFGEFYMTNNSGWIMHTELGWVFVLKEPKKQWCVGLGGTDRMGMDIEGNLSILLP